MFPSRIRIVAFATAAVLATGVACFLALNDSERASAGEDGRSKSRSKRPSPFDKAPAYHFRRTRYVAPGDPGFDPAYEGPPRVRAVEEGWAVRGVGRRVEVRQGGKLVSVTVDTPRWRFLWYITRNLVVAYPSRLEDPVLIGDALVRTRDEWVVPWSERLRATYVSEKDRLDGKEVEKVTFRYLAEPDGDQPIHDWKPGFEKLLQSPDAVFRTRTWWFDPKTHLPVRRKCGCKFPRHDDWVEYPPPESIPRERFQFQVPRDATLEINDPELGRVVSSEGQKGPDLRD